MGQKSRVATQALADSRLHESDNDSSDSETKEEPSPIKKLKPSTVIYIGHLPSLFGEYELMVFLRQFGNVLDVRVSRNKKRNSRGYAFAKFKDANTANVVADTLSGYLLFQKKEHLRKRLVSHVVPPEKIHPQLFFKYNWDKVLKQSQPHRSTTALPKITERLLEKERKKKQKLLALGYDYPGYEGAVQESQSKGDSKTKDGKESSVEGTSSSVEKKRSNSLESMSQKKDRDSVDSVDSGTKQKKRKESIDSSSSSSSSKKKKRKDSVEGVDSASKKKNKKKKRKDSVDESPTLSSTKTNRKEESVDPQSSNDKLRKASIDTKSQNDSEDPTDSKSKKKHRSAQKKKRKDSSGSLNSIDDLFDGAPKSETKAKSHRKKGKNKRETI